jgi:hypothetical protein
MPYAGRAAAHHRRHAVLQPGARFHGGGHALGAACKEYPNLEYIILDGGSTDEHAWPSLSGYAPWLAGWASAPDDGPAQAINRGLARATGDILCWLNADDLYLPGALWAAAEALTRRPAAALVYGEGWYIDEAGEPHRAVPLRAAAVRAALPGQPRPDPAAGGVLAAGVVASRYRPAGRGAALGVRLGVVHPRPRARGEFAYLPREMALYRVQPAALTRTGGLAAPGGARAGDAALRGVVAPQPRGAADARRLDAAGRQGDGGALPGPLAAALRAPLALPRLAAEGLLRGMYMR